MKELTIAELDEQLAEQLPVRELMGGCCHPCYHPCCPPPCHPCCPPPPCVSVEVCVSIRL